MTKYLLLLIYGELITIIMLCDQFMIVYYD